MSKKRKAEADGSSKKIGRPGESTCAICSQKLHLGDKCDHAEREVDTVNCFVFNDKLSSEKYTQRKKKCQKAWGVRCIHCLRKLESVGEACEHTKWELDDVLLCLVCDKRFTAAFDPSGYRHHTHQKEQCEARRIPDQHHQIAIPVVPLCGKTPPPPLPPLPAACNLCNMRSNAAAKSSRAALHAHLLSCKSKGMRDCKPVRGMGRR